MTLSQRAKRPGGFLRAFVVCALLGAAVLPAAAEDDQPQSLPTQSLEIVTHNGVFPFEVEIAQNDTERAKGLMFRRSMPDGHGMLFDFKRDQPVAFWMRNTFISLDMIFIAGNGQIVNIAANTEPMSEKSVPSRGAVRAVLEVTAGTAAKLGIQAGDRVANSIFGSR